MNAHYNSIPAFMTHAFAARSPGLLRASWNRGSPSMNGAGEPKNCRIAGSPLPSRRGTDRLLPARQSCCGRNKGWATPCSSSAMRPSSNSKAQRFCSRAPWSCENCPDVCRHRPRSHAGQPSAPFRCAASSHVLAGHAENNAGHNPSHCPLPVCRCRLGGPLAGRGAWCVARGGSQGEDQCNTRHAPRTTPLTLASSGKEIPDFPSLIAGRRIGSGPRRWRNGSRWHVCREFGYSACKRAMGPNS